MAALNPGNGSSGPTSRALEPAPRRDPPVEQTAYQEFLPSEVRAHNGFGASTEPSTGASAELMAVVASLRAEVHGLAAKVDGLRERARVSEDLTRAALQATVDAHRQTKRALEEQHGAIVNDLVRFRRQITDEMRKAAAEAGLGERDVADEVMAQLDSRLEWLVNEISNRFVILGNEVAGIKKQLTVAEPQRRSGRNGVTEYPAGADQRSTDLTGR